MKTIEYPLSPQEQDEIYADILEDIRAEAAKGYDARLKYHPWSHALDVENRSQLTRNELLKDDKTRTSGVFVTSASALLHDFGYLTYQRALLSGKSLASSAEEYSMSESFPLLLKLGVDPATTEEIITPIIGTKLGVACGSLAKYNLCASDLWNTNDDYETEFKQKTEAFRQETEWIQDKEIDPLGFAAGSLVVLTRYHFENLGILSMLHRHPVFREAYRNRAKNLRHLGREVITAAGVVGQEAVTSFFQKMGDQVAQLCKTDANGEISSEE